MTRKFLITLLPILSFFGCTSQSIDDLSFLTGTWKVDGKETYEAWEKADGNVLKGSSYKIVEGKKIVTETLSIRSLNGKIVYEATVVNQNDGKPIHFTLSSNTSKGYSFENPTHDFPTKIIYKKISAAELVVDVLGADEKGFTLTFFKQ